MVYNLEHSNPYYDKGHHRQNWAPILHDLERSKISLLQRSYCTQNCTLMVHILEDLKTVFYIGHIADKIGQNWDQICLSEPNLKHSKISLYKVYFSQTQNLQDQIWSTRKSQYCNCYDADRIGTFGTKFGTL